MMTFFLKLKQARLRTVLAGLAGTLVLLLILYFSANRQPPLTAEEQLLVGEWYHDPAELPLIFYADRTIESSSQFVGTWQIQEGRLSITYWQPYELPRSLSLASISLSLESIQRSREKNRYGWEISFSDNGQRFSVNHPIEEHHPDGKWWWSRKESQ